MSNKVVKDFRDKLLAYFSGDEMAADVWSDKYQLKNKGVPQEETPADTHRRMAKEFARIEYGYRITEMDTYSLGQGELSEFGTKLLHKRTHQTLQDIEQEFFNYFDKFNQIVPQGSVMANLGNFFIYGSLSNCFGIASPHDSYGGIMRFDEHLAQLEKRRGGVGGRVDSLRPEDSVVTNAAKTSTGPISFCERFSNTTREVAQGGRRGALMLLMHVNHPSIFKFVTMKDDRTKVTGANVSVMFTEEFMQALETGKDFYCRFPIETEFYKGETMLFDLDTTFEYNKLYPLTTDRGSVMKIKPQELFDLVAEMAWKNGEPGVAYYDRVVDYSPEGVYERWRARVCNPCGEQWFAFFETCRLILLNFWGIVKRHFEEGAEIDYDLLYELAYMQQRLGDDLVDLECEYIDRILEKIISDPEPEDIKLVEYNMWVKVKQMAQHGRRTGGGFTALGDMLAALNLKYDSDEAIATVKKVMKTKMRAELDCTIDMAILRGTFTGWDKKKEFEVKPSFYAHLFTESTVRYELTGKNSFYEMLLDEFPQQAGRMYKYGRRNTNWGTLAPGGSMSIMTQSTSSGEPLFKGFYIRRKKVVPGVSNVRVDFVDQNGDSWQEYPVLHPKFKEWIVAKMRNREFAGRDTYMTNLGSYNKQHEYHEVIDELTKNQIENLFKLSPWYGSEADDISWEKRVDMQAVIQTYTTNAVSSTINLPKDVPLETVKGIYLRAYKKGLKGITVYRDGSRSGVLITEPTKTGVDKFGYIDAVKRPKELEAHYYSVLIRGKYFAVIVGMLDGNPYELFAFANAPKNGNTAGKLVKIDRGHYQFQSETLTIENVEQDTETKDEKLLTRMCSQLLRHGVNPKYIIEQVEKSEVTVVSFARSIIRVLKKYLPDENLGEQCDNCGEKTMIRQEGCNMCTSCGHSKC